MTGAQKKSLRSGRLIPLPRNPRLLSILCGPVATLRKRERSHVPSARHPSRSRKSPQKTVFRKRNAARENISFFFSPLRAG
jgi:hypothetical protein